MRHFKIWSSATALVLSLALFSSGQDQKKDEKKPEPKLEQPGDKHEKAPKKLPTESAVRRAADRARAADGEHLARMNAIPSMSLEEPSYVILCEFTSGNLAVFQGGSDPECDQWVLIEKRHMNAISEIVLRSANH